MRPKRSFNPKRQLRPPPGDARELGALRALAERVRYGGNPEHKRDPDDLGLSPPTQPRQGKTLCDDAAVVRRVAALRLLQEGLARGLVSAQVRDGWPQNVWAVTARGVPLEAQREGDGIHHGYPMGSADPLRDDVLSRWGSA